MVLFEPLVYLVSFVLKVWHLLLSSVLQLPASLSWTVSIFLLVVTIRSAIVYFAIQQFVSNRKSANLRPKLLAVRNYYSRNLDPKAPAYASFASSSIRKEHGLSTTALLVPSFIQIPVFMGLVSMLRQMLGSAAAPGQPARFGVGFLSQEEVSQFLHATLFGRPLPAYLNMRPDRFEALGISYDFLFGFCAPAIFAAAIFTALNLRISAKRLGRTLDYSNKVTLLLNRFLRAMIVIAPMSILFFGFVGPTAVALIVYWVCNNFWTLAQNFLLTRYIEAKYPLSPKFIALQNSQKAEHNTVATENRALKIAKRKARLAAIIAPKQTSRLQAEYRAKKDAVEKRRQAKKTQEHARALKIAQARWVIGQMRPAAQDSFPSLSGNVPLHDGHVPSMPGVQRAREEALKKQKRVQATPKPLLITMMLAQQAGKGARNKIRKVTGTEPSKWKRFRD